VLPEDGTLVTKHVGATSLIFIFALCYAFFGRIN